LAAKPPEKGPTSIIRRISPEKGENHQTPGGKTQGGEKRGTPPNSQIAVGPRPYPLRKCEKIWPPSGPSREVKMGVKKRAKDYSKRAFHKPKNSGTTG